MNPGESIWLGSFEVMAPVNWIAGAGVEPVLLKTGTSITVYEDPSSNPMATVCSGNLYDVNKEFPEAFSSRYANERGSKITESFAARTKAFTLYECDESSLRSGVDSRLPLNVYPNPTSGMLNISFIATDTEKYLLSVADMNGKVLYSEQNTSQKGLNLDEIDLSEMAKGMYTISIEREQKEKQTIRIAVE